MKYPVSLLKPAWPRRASGRPSAISPEARHAEREADATVSQDWAPAALGPTTGRPGTPFKTERPATAAGAWRLPQLSLHF